MESEHYDAVIVGAGFSGMYALHKLRDDLQFNVIAVEQGSDVGGTWYWNRYQGARCDAESIYYSYSFSLQVEQGWSWTEKYATGPEIFEYARYVADCHDLRRSIRFKTTVEAAVFDEQSNVWQVRTSDGRSVSASFLIMATGPLSIPYVPDFRGRDKFKGRAFHTSEWPDDLDLTGKRVACIGTGSSGIQTCTAIAPAVSQLYVMQRSANFAVPSANRPLTPEEIEAVKAAYPEERRNELRSKAPKTAMSVGEEERLQHYSEMWEAGGLRFLNSFSDIMFDEQANETVAEFARSKIREIVENPEVAEALCPVDHPFGSKRLCVDTGYYEIFNRPNVTLVDLRRDPIVEFTETGIKTEAHQYDVDVVIFATGFDAMTGAVRRIDLVGRNGMKLKDKWSHGPTTYLGFAISGFPNLFLIHGPGSPSVLENMIRGSENQVDWVSRCLAYLRRNGIETIEATPEAEADWTEHVNRMANATLFPRSNSWWAGANIDGKPRAFMPYVAGLRRYMKFCYTAAAQRYRGFVLDGKDQSGDEDLTETSVEDLLDVAEHRWYGIAGLPPPPPRRRQKAVTS
ncbi:MAG TPA: NAD(P)/FAD-dependent oxidoreductase [Acidimicrobiales bacterium]|nr:NAD(P)/FAD-dependent oxidoreductase [Acidimicrobiales bacterium]